MDKWIEKTGAVFLCKVLLSSYNTMLQKYFVNWIVIRKKRMRYEILHHMRLYCITFKASDIQTSNSKLHEGMNLCMNERRKAEAPYLHIYAYVRTR